jgi:hypothetical protein
MLYASSRSTLISTLGLRTQRLANQIIATSNADLTYPSVDAQISLSDLSIREKELVEIKAAEAESAHGTTKRSATSSGIHFPMGEDAQTAVAALISGGDDLVQLVSALFNILTKSVSKMKPCNLLLLIKLISMRKYEMLSLKMNLDLRFFALSMSTRAKKRHLYVSPPPFMTLT